MKFKGVIFDLDGTLLDTIDDLAAAMNVVLARMGLPTHSRDKYFRFVGDGAKMLVRRALPQEHRNEETVSNCFQQWRREYVSRYAQNTHPYDGIDDLLASFAARGMKSAVLSNKEDDITRQMVAAFFPEHPFLAVLGKRAAVAKKPDPAAALEIADRLGLAPEAFLYLGDTNVDMQTANRAGMFAVGVLWGFREAHELLENGARILIHHPDDLRLFL
jgi:phosphoglycolate phosphatase